MNLHFAVLALLVSLPCYGLAQEYKTPQGEAERTLGEVIDDATITAKIKTALLAEDDVKALRINVDTLEGKVTLTGSAESREQIEQAGEIAAGVAGVKSVDNRLALKQAETGSPPAVTVRTRIEESSAGEADRTAGEFIDDAWINAKVKAALMRDEKVPGMQINVDTVNKVVTLTGQLADRAVADKAVKLAAAVKGVKSVNDQLQVAGEGAAGRVGTASSAPSPGDVSKRGE
ncbi:MAG: BON domain-containing protein [Burkholderiales bacterium]